jgi:hypothetical protein
MSGKDDQIAAWLAAGGVQTPMRAKANELLTGSLADHSGGLTEHEILANALRAAFEEGQRNALEQSLMTPVDVNACTPLEYELRGPEALLVLANSGVVQDWRSELFMMAGRWAQAIRDRAQMREALEAIVAADEKPTASFCGLDHFTFDAAVDLVEAALGKSVG